jgi:hypothetical protein
MDALLKAAEREGFRLDSDGGDWRQRLRLVIEGQPLQFRIREYAHQEEVAQSSGQPRGFRSGIQYRPTGRLALELLHAWYAPRSVWRDTEKRSLEGQLGDFLSGAREAARLLRAHRLEAERAQEARRLEQEAQRREQLRREEARERQRNLVTLAEQWHQSRRVAAFIDEVQARASKEGLASADALTFDAWLRWARGCADDLDPLSHGLDPILSTPP